MNTLLEIITLGISVFVHDWTIKRACHGSVENIVSKIEIKQATPSLNTAILDTFSVTKAGIKKQFDRLYFTRTSRRTHINLSKLFGCRSELEYLQIFVLQLTKRKYKSVIYKNQDAKQFLFLKTFFLQGSVLQCLKDLLTKHSSIIRKFQDVLLVNNVCTVYLKFVKKGIKLGLGNHIERNISHLLIQELKQ